VNVVLDVGSVESEKAPPWLLFEDLVRCVAAEVAWVEVVEFEFVV
jgi:hypothetical protein